MVGRAVAITVWSSAASSRQVMSAPMTSQKRPRPCISGLYETGPAPDRAVTAVTRRAELLPLDGARRPRRDVVDDAVDARHLVDDAARQPLEQVVGQPGPVGGHGVVAVD